MGGEQSTNKGLDGVIHRATSRAGTIQISGRYHKKPKVFANDYTRTDKILGTGYNGQVFQATRKSAEGGKTDAKYAVKPFALHGIGKEKREELELEVEIFLAMDHPHVARLVDVYEDDKQLLLVMECMEGGELFKHVVDKKRIVEKEAADAVHQMLQSLNYIHKQGIVHRDIKLENFMYEDKSKTYLKLIDFGFSKIWAPNTQMQLSCGTLAYVAPEVLGKNYGSQCDMWSFGVTVFIMLFGYMPFSGSEDTTMRKIKNGDYNVKKDVWAKVSSDGQTFVRSLLMVDPSQRLTPETALLHPWIANRAAIADSAADPKVDQDIATNLMQFRQATHFRRACMNMMAWSLTYQERKQVRDAFLAMDTSGTGTISLNDFKKVMEEQFNMQDDEVTAAFQALDSNHDEHIHYADFLAANISRRLAMHSDLMHQTFARFDTDSTGFITKDNLKGVLGKDFTDAEIDGIISMADKAHDGKISYKEWMEYLQGGDASSDHKEIAVRVVDKELESSDRKRTCTPKGSSTETSAATSSQDSNVSQPCDCRCQ